MQNETETQRTETIIKNPGAEHPGSTGSTAYTESPAPVRCPLGFPRRGAGRESGLSDQSTTLPQRFPESPPDFRGGRSPDLAVPSHHKCLTNDERLNVPASYWDQSFFLTTKITKRTKSRSLDLQWFEPAIYSSNLSITRGWRLKRSDLEICRHEVRSWARASLVGNYSALCGAVIMGNSKPVRQFSRGEPTWPRS